jgi:hypothetical protein
MCVGAQAVVHMFAPVSFSRGQSLPTTLPSSHFLHHNQRHQHGDYDYDDQLQHHLPVLQRSLQGMPPGQSQLCNTMAMMRNNKVSPAVSRMCRIAQPVQGTKTDMCPVLMIVVEGDVAAARSTPVPAVSATATAAAAANTAAAAAAAVGSLGHGHTRQQYGHVGHLIATTGIGSIVGLVEALASDSDSAIDSAIDSSTHGHDNGGAVGSCCK